MKVSSDLAVLSQKLTCDNKERKAFPQNSLNLVQSQSLLSCQSTNRSNLLSSRSSTGLFQPSSSQPVLIPKITQAFDFKNLTSKRQVTAFIKESEITTEEESLKSPDIHCEESRRLDKYLNESNCTSVTSADENQAKD